MEKIVRGKIIILFILAIMLAMIVACFNMHISNKALPALALFMGLCTSLMARTAVRLFQLLIYDIPVSRAISEAPAVFCDPGQYNKFLGALPFLSNYDVRFTHTVNKTLVSIYIEYKGLFRNLIGDKRMDEMLHKEIYNRKKSSESFIILSYEKKVPQI